VKTERVADEALMATKETLMVATTCFPWFQAVFSPLEGVHGPANGWSDGYPRNRAGSSPGGAVGVPCAELPLPPFVGPRWALLLVEGGGRGPPSWQYLGLLGVGGSAADDRVGRSVDRAADLCLFLA
jgi:hypothetical protein